MKMSKLSNQTNSQDPQAVNSRVFVGNLNTFQCSKTDVERMFQRYGRLVGISMHKGYAFVQFTNPFDARNACHGEDGKTILSQVLDVNMVAEPKPHQIGRKRQNITKTGNDWDYYYDSYCASALFQGTGQRPTKRQRLMSQQQQQRSLVNNNKLSAVQQHAVAQQQQHQHAAAAAAMAMAAQAALLQPHHHQTQQQHLAQLHQNQQNLLANGTSVNSLVAAAAAAASSCNGTTSVHNLSPQATTNGLCMQTSPLSGNCTNNNNITNNNNNLNGNYSNCEQMSSLLCANGQTILQQQLINLPQHQQQQQQQHQQQQQQHQQQQQQQQQQQHQQQEQSSMLGTFKTYSNPDTLICGNCRECFTDLAELLDHKRSYCKLRFTCKCQDTVAASVSKNPLPPSTKLLCAVCKDAFSSPWDLMVHAQAAHMVNIYALGGNDDATNSNSINDATAKNDTATSTVTVSKILNTLNNRLITTNSTESLDLNQQNNQNEINQQVQSKNSKDFCINNSLNNNTDSINRSSSSSISDNENHIEMNGNFSSPGGLNLKEDNGHPDDVSLDGRISSPVLNSDDIKINVSLSSAGSSPVLDSDQPRACIVRALSIEAATNQNNTPTSTAIVWQSV